MPCQVLGRAEELVAHLALDLAARLGLLVNFSRRRCRRRCRLQLIRLLRVLTRVAVLGLVVRGRREVRRVVLLEVVLQGRRLGERLWTVVTLVRVNSQVDPAVHDQPATAGKRLQADVARDLLKEIEVRTSSTQTNQICLPSLRCEASCGRKVPSNPQTPSRSICT